MDMMNDDPVYVRDMGLVVDRPTVRIANPIYQELIPRALNFVMHASGSVPSALLRTPG